MVRVHVWPSMTYASKVLDCSLGEMYCGPFSSFLDGSLMLFKYIIARRAYHQEM